jgi:hypothetical protein
VSGQCEREPLELVRVPAVAVQERRLSLPLEHQHVALCYRALGLKAAARASANLAKLLVQPCALAGQMPSGGTGKRR